MSDCLTSEGELEALRDWLLLTIAEIEEMGRDDPAPRKPLRAANGRFVKKEKS